MLGREERTEGAKRKKKGFFFSFCNGLVLAPSSRARFFYLITRQVGGSDCHGKECVCGGGAGQREGVFVWGRR